MAHPGDGLTRTDADGRFVLPTLGRGTYQRWIRRIGYRERLEEVTVRAGQRTRLTITLYAATPTLDTVRARVSQNAFDNRTLLGFEYRRQSGIGYFRDANELAASEPVSQDARERSPRYAEVALVDGARCGGDRALRSLAQDPAGLPTGRGQCELRSHRVPAHDGAVIARAMPCETEDRTAPRV